MNNLYKKSGVNIDKANLLVKNILPNIQSDYFCSLIDFGNVYIATCTDGIGSKILPLYERSKFNVIANDLLAMNFNDLACVGATPIGFTDYIAVNKLDEKKISIIIKELSKQLAFYNCVLQGGETSELKNIIKNRTIDISGYTIGSVNKNKLLSPSKVSFGDKIIGLVSEGAHSNGFSLIRQLFKEKKLTKSDFENCLKPTTIYLKEILKLNEKNLIKSCANITGGGIVNNLKRAIPNELKFDLDFSKIPVQLIFKKLENICKKEAWSVFNMGVGFCVICEEKNVKEVLKITEKYSSFVFGEIK